jgi:hypothetical protein
MTIINLSRRLERLEARAPSMEAMRSVLINFVGPDGSVTSSLLLEPGKPSTKVPAGDACSKRIDRPQSRSPLR